MYASILSRKRHLPIVLANLITTTLSSSDYCPLIECTKGSNLISSFAVATQHHFFTHSVALVNSKVIVLHFCLVSCSPARLPKA